MLPVLTPAESAALDRAGAERGLSIDALMEAAGRAVARAVADVAGGTYGRRVVVVCGKGNNGGDGLVAARYLDRWGCRAVAVLGAPRDELRAPTVTNLRRFIGQGGVCVPYSADRLARELERADIAVDAIFGTGFSGEPSGDMAAAITLLNRARAGVVAVDVPSGVEGETGAIRGEAVRAELTVTFGTWKPGLLFFPGASRAGEVIVADIGFDRDMIDTDLWLVEAEDVARLLPARLADGHKRSSGVVLVVAGSRSMTGAAALAAMAAYRAGAGLVTLAAPECIVPVLEAVLTEATFLPLAQTEEGTIAAEAWPSLEGRLRTVDAVAAGPGLTANEATAGVARRLLAESPAPLVLDADGLNAFAGREEELRRRSAGVVLTPHLGEFERLTRVASKDVLQDRVGHIRKFAAAWDCTVLLKGTRTLVGEPGGRVRVNPTGSSALSTGGTGDVLTGALAAFLARGLSPADAAVAAAYVHGAAGRLAGEDLGEGAVASDVMERLPKAIDMVRGEGAQ